MTTQEDEQILDQLDDYVDPADTEQDNAGKKDTVQGSYAGVQACSFRDMLLKAELQRAIGDAGFEHPSEVQQNAIPFAMVGQDDCPSEIWNGKNSCFCYCNPPTN